MLRSALVLGLLALPGQSFQEPPAVLLQSTTRLIQVDVVVRDKNGQPVPGLAQSDFELFEDGRRQQVRFFSVTRPRPAQPAGVAPGMVSNRVLPEGTERGVSVILVDSLNTDWRARATARANLRKFLLGARPDDRIALYTLGGNLQVMHDFTSDAASLLKRLDAQSDQANFGDNLDQLSLLKDLIPEAAALLKWSIAREGDFRNTQRAIATFSALEAIARHVGAIPARKSLIWISSGFPLSINANAKTATATSLHGLVNTGENRNFSAEFDKAFKELSAANVAVYPLDPRGLQGLSEFDAISRSPSADRSWIESDSMLTQIARRTGGRAFVSQNDILGSLRQVAAEAEATYTLAYYPPSEKFDGRFRRIEVSVKRDGLKAAHRQGYYALDEKELKRADAAEAMRAAARDPLDSSLIGIDAVLKRQTGTETMELLARIDVEPLLWREAGGFSVAANVGLLQFDAEGRQLARSNDGLTFTVDAAKAAALAKNGLSFRRGVDVKPDAARVRLVVRSARTGAIGTLTVPVPKDARP